MIIQWISSNILPILLFLLQVCEEQKCQDEVFSLAMNYMDRFLMCCSIRKNQLQLLGTACMLLASKLRESRPLAGETLIYYTDHSITKKQLWVSLFYWFPILFIDYALEVFASKFWMFRNLIFYITETCGDRGSEDVCGLSKPHVSQVNQISF